MPRPVARPVRRNKYLNLVNIDMYNALSDKSDFLPQLDSDCNGRFTLRRSDLHRIKNRLIKNDSNAEYDSEDLQESFETIKFILKMFRKAKTHKEKFNTLKNYF